MKYTIWTELGDERELTSSKEIEWAVDRLMGEAGSFLCVQPELPISGINYMQAAYIRRTKGLFKKIVVSSYYEVEVQKEKPGGDLYQCNYRTEDWACVLELFRGFYESQRLPDLAGWERELFCQAEK